ncbi:hypothetical protein HOP60_09990 [Halomonas daqingensis]|uniref:Uncharacterized protein n=1 Tax=Billgrantia desiderata TaxID=52021 RepID=A0ABS9B4D8_9GAMM|nr:hypothetical protein [Halomonas desiderata]MCE8042484.1 hypothetical protein [Halomonas desiderata]MCE8047059.1 hypothetical protein [Halomonas desiderata]
MSLALSISRLGAAAGIATAAAGGFQEHLYQLRQSASTPTRNGGRRRTVAQHKRKAAKRRAVRRAKRLGHT